MDFLEFDNVISNLGQVEGEKDDRSGQAKGEQGQGTKGHTWARVHQLDLDHP